MASVELNIEHCIRHRRTNYLKLGENETYDYTPKGKARVIFL